MSKHLVLISGAKDYAQFRLPADEDIPALQSRLTAAMQTGTVEDVVVEMGNNPLNRGHRARHDESGLGRPAHR